MKLNLGCGDDIKKGYINIDFRDMPGVLRVDLSKFPWPFQDNSADEILMLDFLEHFPYDKTYIILKECYRILKSEYGKLIVQVPDFAHCSRAATGVYPFKCNSCGYNFSVVSGKFERGDYSKCKCGQTRKQIEDAAIHRLYGGQNFEGNWHYTAFTPQILARMLHENNFGALQFLEKKHQYANWNFKFSAMKDNECTAIIDGDMNIDFDLDKWYLHEEEENQQWK